MKKLVLFLVLMLFPIKLYAISGNVSLTCPKELEINKVYTCTLKGFSSEEVAALSLKIASSSNILISNVKTSNTWQGNGDNGNVILYTDNNKKGNFDIATFNIKLLNSEPSSVNINNVKFTDASFVQGSVSGTTMNFVVKKVTTTTKQTTTTSKTTNKTTYTTASKTNVNTSTKKETENKKESNTLLKSLNISNVSIDFNKNKTNYNLKVSNDINEVNIEAIPESDKSKVIYTKNVKLNIGENKIIIKVIAEDGTIKEYNIIINKLERKLSSNSSLKLLKISGLDFNFDSKVKTYDLGVIKKDKLDIHYLTEDENAKVIIYGNKSISKDDVVIVKVIAEDLSVSEYILYVSSKSINKNIIFIISSLLIVLTMSIAIIFTRKK